MRPAAVVFILFVFCTFTKNLILFGIGIEKQLTQNGKGGFIYNYGIEDVTEEVTVDPASEYEGRAGGSSDSEAENQEPHTATVTKYRRNALVMVAPKTQNNILETLLSETYPGHVEQKLFNDYNAAKEKVLPSLCPTGRSRLSSPAQRKSSSRCRA